jgi:hypothetical protein
VNDFGMTKRTAIALLAFLFLEPSLWADTLTLRSNAEINGSVQYDNNAFTVTARYSSGDHKITYGRREVRTLEINSREFNPGEPPTNISMFSEHIPGTEDAAHTASSSKKEKPAGKKRLGAGNLSVFVTEDYDRMTTDVIMLQNKTKLVGRIARLQNGYLTIQNGSETKEVAAQQVVIVRLAEE